MWFGTGPKIKKRMELSLNDAYLERKHHVASWHLHLELHRLTQHLPSTFVILSSKPGKQGKTETHKKLCWKFCYGFIQVATSLFHIVSFIAPDKTLS